jgi:hypothetical protein
MEPRSYITHQTLKPDYGYVESEIGNITITGLVIVKYDRSDDYYLFACNPKWEVMGDIMHDSLGKAMEFAKEYYDLESIVWNEMKGL